MPNFRLLAYKHVKVNQQLMYTDNNNNNKLLFKHDKNYSEADVVVYLHVIKSYLP